MGLAPATALVVSLIVTAINPERGPWSRLSPRYSQDYLRRSVIEVLATARAPRHYPLGAGLGTYKETINELRQYGEHVPHPEDQKVPRDGNSQYAITTVEAGVASALILLLVFLLPFIRRRHEQGSGALLADASCESLLIVAVGSVFCVTVSRGLGVWLGAMLGLIHVGSPPGLRRRVLRLLPPVLAGLLAGGALIGMRHQENNTITAALQDRFSGRKPEKPELRVIEIIDDGSGLVTIGLVTEGEDASEIERPFVVVSDPDASGGAALGLPDQSGKGVGGATYHVEIPEAGEYRLHARVFWQDGCSNSVLFEVADEKILLAGDLYLRWHRLDAKRPVQLPAGTTTVVIRNVEDGIRIDSFGFTPIDN